MAKTRTDPTGSTPAHVRKRIWLLAAAFLLVEIVVLPGAASPFRAPKSALAVSAILVIAGPSVAAGLWRGGLGLRWSPLATVLAVLPMLQAASMLWSGSALLARDAALTTAIWVLAGLWLATASACERRRLVDAAALGAALSGLVLIAQAAGAKLLAVGAAGPTGRLTLTGLTGNPADLALAAVLLLPLVLTTPDGASTNWFRRTLAALLTAAAVVSQTMTAVVALALVWGIWLIQRRSRRLWAAAAVTVVLVVAVGLATGLDERVKRQIRRVETGDWYFLLSARSDGWTAAGEMIRDRPLIGVGAANFTHAYYPSRIAWLERSGAVGSRAELATHFRFAHCDPLQVTAELGLVGLLWLAALVLATVRMLPRGDPRPALSLAAV
ncbi:MAG: O-antigen ligase family protein, partial [Holophagae bacterium]